ncbi:hypothetical protein [Intestinibacter bartlettii]|uniref:hypothetical protein n=1 Tax=Intestinibacter bartlettii TaxID=261299 RepID=UPI003AB1982C
MDLKEMTVDELKNLALDIKEELNKRIRDIKQAQVEVNRILDKTYTFYFKTECDIRNKGYVARCTYGKKGIERYFYNLQETRCRNDVVIEGDFEAHELDVLDIRYRNNNYGYSQYCIILNGKITEICDVDDIHKISTLKRYLKGEIVFENFLEIVGIKEVKVGALDELLED